MDDLSEALETETIRGFSPNLGWSHYRALMDVENENERLFYEIEAEKENWDVKHLNVLESFGVSASGGQGKSKDNLFLEALRQTMDDEGYTITSALADKFGELCRTPVEDREDALDRFSRKAMYDDRLVIESYHTGQPRMGRGLFGDSNCRRLKIEFTPSARGTVIGIKTNNNLAEEQ